LSRLLSSACASSRRTRILARHLLYPVPKPASSAGTEGTQMDQALLESTARGDAVSFARMLKQAPIDDLDEVVAMLKRYLSTEEICTALTERIEKAPLEDLQS